MLIFTFHHGTAEAWDVLARALDEAGFSIRRIWPVYAEMDVGVPVMGKQSVKYDAVLVCRKRGEAVASTMVDTLQALASQVAGETRSLVAMLAEVGDLSEADQRNLSWAVAAMMYTQHQTRLLPSALEGI